jgi:PilX N-terminal
MLKQPLPLGNERGIALVAALVIMALLIVLGTIALNSTFSELQVAGNDKRNRLAFYAAESGVEFARAQIRAAFAVEQDLGSVAAVAFVTTFASSPPDIFTPPTDYTFKIKPVPVTPVGSGTAPAPYRFKLESRGTAAGNATSVIEVEFQMTVLTSPLKYAAYGRDSVSLANASYVMAYDSAVDPDPTISRLDEGADVSSGGAVNITGLVSIDGTAEPDPDYSADPIGLLTPGGRLDLAFNAAMTTNNNSTPALSSYLTGTELTVSTPTTISLPPGDYYFTEMTLTNDVTIDIDGGPGEVNIYLDGSLTTSASHTATLNPGGLPTDFSIYSKASDVGDSEGDPSSIDFKGRAIINGLVYAPDADMVFDKTSDISGALLGKSIDFHASSCWNYDVQMKNKFPPGNIIQPLPIVSWREI